MLKFFLGVLEGWKFLVETVIVLLRSHVLGGYVVLAYPPKIYGLFFFVKSLTSCMENIFIS